MINENFILSFLDADECANNNGGCEHECMNTNGSYYCKCNAGYELSLVNHTCEGDYSSKSLGMHISLVKWEV